jgi:hypothetical protein
MSLGYRRFNRNFFMMAEQLDISLVARQRCGN